MQRLSVLFVFILLCLLTSTLGRGGQTTKGPANELILERRVERVEKDERVPRPNNTAVVFLDALAGAKTSGGIIKVYDCLDTPIVHGWNPEGFVLRDSLDMLVHADPAYRWGIENGVVNLLPATGEPALLKTHIDSFEVKNISSLDAIAGWLLDTPQAKNAIAKLNLTDGLKITVGPGSLNPQPGYSIKLKNVTVRDALNAIARLHKKRAVWSFREKHCDGKIEYWLDFIVE